ncbi:GntR family transcriptional regulator [Clostridium tetanomorphum]|uniref:GntR family transcriptional regulator n=1 Tax=Clostridium tetanomorphum TaxID=1553 RepID=A0A923J153_CLOTT|nr:GntR family transcriptional regulator [Clostridium tetanomorphum]KAJ53890.1 GntR family transcriptional regulator [Clostridium tetanomorphum DSM 665]MBC2397405.1 GntR family transcriptional regulator [Clostridium tetanomorphum]MBP1862625.1 GntR family transcriptional regulator [Clostridium tetanomorphum]NRS85534.1 GntR family transcriptional regulator [Clostridium tetanomorphum]NRZ96455.1 GntR family transcriptional regulator [Clostridium tetanomorphum]
MININSRSSKSIYEQIVDQIKENILKGILNPGDKLPSVRELSSMLTINPNTVSKAYRELERQKTIETIRGKGTYVSSNYNPKIDEDKLEFIKNDLKKLIVEAYYMGIDKKEFKNILDQLYNNFERM